ncbi:hypothetical protein [Ammoniphilus sp. 3BR4]|uniref:hypothetical protein n=1 Tax=Ammoniphilus sp. 3BR4 TaxID=3158265 RepID=UPI003466B703
MWDEKRKGVLIEYRRMVIALSSLGIGVGGYVCFSSQKVIHTPGWIQSVIEPIKQAGIQTVSFDEEVFDLKWNTAAIDRYKLSNQRISYVQLDGKMHFESAEDILGIIELKK